MRTCREGLSCSVDFIFDGQAVHARPGESVAAALFATGIRTLRRSPREQQPRGMFCLMGSCQECLVMIERRPVLACRTPVASGLVVGLVEWTGSGEPDSDAPGPGPGPSPDFQDTEARIDDRPGATLR